MASFVMRKLKREEGLEISTWLPKKIVTANIPLPLEPNEKHSFVGVPIKETSLFEKAVWACFLGNPVLVGWKPAGARISIFGGGHVRHEAICLRHPDDGMRFHVNFDWEILQLIRETRCLDRMGPGLGLAPKWVGWSERASELLSCDISFMAAFFSFFGKVQQF